MRMVGEVVFQQFKAVNGLREGSGEIDPLTRKANFARCPNPITTRVLAWDVATVGIIEVGASSGRSFAVSGSVGR